MTGLRTRSLVVACAGMAAWLCSGIAEAQSQSLQQGGGRSTGTTQSGGGTSGTGGTTGGTVGGSARSGGGAGGGSAFTGPQLNTELGNLGAQMGTGFIGQGQPGSEGFVGSAQIQGGGQTGGQQRTFNVTGAGGRGGSTGRTGGFNQFNTQNRGLGSGSSVVYHAPHVVAFSVPRPSTERISSRLDVNLERIRLNGSKFGNVAYRIADDRTVVLTGTVVSDDNRQLAELYVRMEPGVDQVVNQLTVESGEAAELPRQ